MEKSTLHDERPKLNYELIPDWSEEEQVLISKIWRIFKENPENIGMRKGIDVIREFNFTNALIDLQKTERERQIK